MARSKGKGADIAKSSSIEIGLFGFPSAVQGSLTVSPEPPQRSMLSNWWIFASRKDNKCYLSIVLVCSVLVMNNGEHIFICFSFSVKCLFVSPVHFSIRLLGLFFFEVL